MAERTLIGERDFTPEDLAQIREKIEESAREQNTDG